MKLLNSEEWLLDELTYQFYGIVLEDTLSDLMGTDWIDVDELHFLPPIYAAAGKSVDKTLEIVVKDLRR